MNEQEFNIIVASRIKYYLKKYQITQEELAKRIGVSQAAVNNWCNGKKSPRMSKVDAMCEVFHCRRSDLINDTAQSQNILSKKIPVLGRVAAGVPIEMIEDIVDEVEIPGKWEGEHFGLVIHGDSMEPKISDGDIVIVKKQDYIENGQIGIITVNGEDATCKHIFKYADTLVLRSNNPKYEEMVYTKEQVEALPVRILGRVVELRAKF